MANGKIDLPKTVKEVGLQDVKKFLPIEEGAKSILRHGNRSGKQVIPEDWVRYSTILWTTFQEMNRT